MRDAENSFKPRSDWGATLIGGTEGSYIGGFPGAESVEQVREEVADFLADARVAAAELIDRQAS